MFNFDKDTFYWFSLDWFSPHTLQEFTWENYYYLYAIPLVPCLLLIRWLLHFKFRTRFDIALQAKDLKKWDLIGSIRFIPYGFMALCTVFILVSLARPQKVNETLEQFNEGIDIVLLLDISESMELQDLKPNRLESAKEVARNFIKGRQHDRIGIVVFKGEAYSLSPLTTDYSLLNSFINDINFDMIKVSGTAVGSAISVGINRMRESDSKSRVMILLSDGENTAGNISPIMASELAHAFDIKIYSIGVGKDGTIAYSKDENGKTQYAESFMDESTLRKIAEVADGKFFRVTNNNALNDVFMYIDKHEKGAIKENKFKDTKDYYEIYLAWASVFFLCWLLTKSTFLSNALED